MPHRKCSHYERGYYDHPRRRPSCWRYDQSYAPPQLMLPHWTPYPLPPFAPTLAPANYQPAEKPGLEAAKEPQDEVVIPNDTILLLPADRSREAEGFTKKRLKEIFRPDSDSKKSVELNIVKTKKKNMPYKTNTPELVCFFHNKKASKGKNKSSSSESFSSSSEEDTRSNKNTKRVRYTECNCKQARGNSLFRKPDKKSSYDVRPVKEKFIKEEPIKKTHAKKAKEQMGCCKELEEDHHKILLMNRETQDRLREIYDAIREMKDCIQRDASRTSHRESSLSSGVRWSCQQRDELARGGRTSGLSKSRVSLGEDEDLRSCRTSGLRRSRESLHGSEGSARGCRASRASSRSALSRLRATLRAEEEDRACGRAREDEGCCCRRRASVDLTAMRMQSSDEGPLRQEIECPWETCNCNDFLKSPSSEIYCIQLPDDWYGGDEE